MKRQVHWLRTLPSAWETPAGGTGPDARHACLGADGNHLPGVRLRILVCFMQTRLPRCAAAFLEDSTMGAGNQRRGKAAHIVGMDAHSEKIQLSLCRWEYGSDPVEYRRICTDLRSLEGAYLDNVPRGAMTVLEASSNAFHIAGRLSSAGYAATVANPDVLSGMARGDRVNDAIDAFNLARAYARGLVREVRVPSEGERGMREVVSGYADAVKDCTRCSNRLWALSSGHGLPWAWAAYGRRAELVREAIDAAGFAPGGCMDFRAREALSDFEEAVARRDRYKALVCAAVAGSPGLRGLMQVPGFGPVVAYAFAAHVGDVSRFATPKRLVSYLGLNPVVASSGKDDGPHKVSEHGNRVVKALLIEAAQAALRSGPKAMRTWGRHLMARGKHYNKAVAAVARKLVVIAWHVMSGHPAPDREMEPLFRRKMAALASKAGRLAVMAMGYEKTSAFVDAVAGPIYAHVTQPADESGQSALKGKANSMSRSRCKKIVD